MVPQPVRSLASQHFAALGSGQAKSLCLGIDSLGIDNYLRIEFATGRFDHGNESLMGIFGVGQLALEVDL